MLMMSRFQASAFGLSPMATVVSWAQSGVDPAIMGTGPISAVQKAVGFLNLMHFCCCTDYRGINIDALVFDFLFFVS